MTIKAVGFDFFGTLVEAKADSESCLLSMYRHLQDRGYSFSDQDFVSNYRSVVAECRRARQEELREVNNCVWVADTLRRMGYDVIHRSHHVVEAVERYFSPWKITIASDAEETLKRLRSRFTVALISNFTDSSYIHRSLRGLGIEVYFDHIIISDSVGWRKPHPEIFKRFLELSKAEEEEAVFIGDELATDIKGAKDIGMKAVLLARGGHQSRQGYIHPDRMVNSLTEFADLLLGNKL